MPISIRLCIVRSLKMHGTGAVFIFGRTDMKLLQRVKGYFTKGELWLWCGSVTVILLAYLLFDGNDILTLPASLTALEDEAFVGMPSTEIVLPDGIKTIGARAFADNQNLVLINLPKSVASVAPDAFSGCNHLTLLCTEGSFGAHYAQTYDIPCILIPAD